MDTYLIVNADDFGLSSGVNRGIVEAHVRGVVTSASLMVRGPSCEEAARLAREQPSLAVGLHVDLGQWTHTDEGWAADYEVVDLGDARAVAREVSRQLRLFEELLGRPPTHLDSHQHVHRDGHAKEALVATGDRLGVGVRHHGPVRYRGDFYGQDRHGASMPEAVSVEAFVRIVRSLEHGWTEIACHPGWGDIPGPYQRERVRELEVLCDPIVRSVIDEANICLSSFADHRSFALGAPRGT